MATDKGRRDAARKRFSRLLLWLPKTARHWTRPRSTDPEEAFREGAIRLVYPILVLSRPILIIYRHIIEARPLPKPLSVELLLFLWGLLAVLSLVSLYRRKIGQSGLFLMLLWAEADLLGVVITGYWHPFLRMSLFLEAIGAAFVLQTRYLFPYTLFLVSAFIGLTFTFGASWSPAPIIDGRPLTTPALVSVGVFIMLMIEAILTYYLRAEVDKRIEAYKKLIDILEATVGARTSELVATNKKLKELSEAKSEFVSNVSHELRTPISNIKLYLHLLTSRPDKRDAHLLTLQRETRRLENLIEGLLTLSRLDQGRVELNLEPTDLAALTSELIGDRLSLARDHNLTLTYTTNPEQPLPKAQADRVLFEQAVSILLTNAFNYTPEGGQVNVSTRLIHEDGLDWACLTVTDTGPGIPLDEQAQLFERFFRGQVGRRSGAPGTGLGLSIAKEIINLHQGRITVQSSGIDGQGATFTIWLPTS